MLIVSSLITALLWLSSTSIVTAAAEAPVCMNNDSSSSGCGSTCSMWYIPETGWILAGRDYKRNEVVGWQDVMVHFTQHDRRAFPLWARYTYFTQIPNKPYEFVFAPPYMSPLECHTTLHNIHFNENAILNESKIHKLSPELKTNVAVKAGDPFFMPCFVDSFTMTETVDDFPNLSLSEIEEVAVCLDTIANRPSTKVANEQGAFAKQSFKQGDTVTQGPALHMHRSELYNATGNYHEELLNYCYGHPKSNLLLLPLAPGATLINHDGKEPNIKIEWDMEMEQVEEMLRSELYMQGEDPIFYVKYVALKDIAPDEELVMDYGNDWQTAWGNRDTNVPFRHEIGFNSFPEFWLERVEPPFPAFHAKKLQPGEVDVARLESGEELAPYIHRIGLPDGLTTKVAAWAEDIGVTAIMEKYIYGKEMDIGGQERVRINGGTWWLRRFDNEWQSNLFYITPDDDESNEQFMHALGDAGWDVVLDGIGKHFNVKTLSNFYPSFIALTQSQYSFMHSDSDHDKVWNVLFPVVQSNATNSAGIPEAEVNLGRNTDSPLGTLNVPYKYETDHAVSLGLDGQHGTAPGDYRGTGQYRMVVSVYMGDFTDEQLLDEYVYQWEDPPYPRKHKLRDSLQKRQHWKYDDPSIKAGIPQVKV